MKNTRIYLAAMAVAVFLMASCQKEEIVNQEFSASMEVTTSGGKTTLDGTQLKWVHGTDQVSITSNNGTTYATSTFTAVTHSSGNPSYAKLNLNEGQQELPEGDGVTYTAIYPASIAGSNNTTVTIPAVQASTSGELTEYPMYAPQTSSKKLQFKNLCSVLKIGLTGSERVSKIEVVTDQYLNGTFTIGGTAAAPTLDPLSTATDHKKVTTLTLSSPVQLSTSTSYFYIYLPANTYKYIKVNVYNATEQIFTKSASISAGAFLVRSNSHLLEFQNITFEPNVLSGEFTVADNRKVSFSKGNLLLVSGGSFTQSGLNHTGSGIYKFADNQYAKNDGSNPTYTSWLFEWGVTEDVGNMFTRWKEYTYTNFLRQTWNFNGSIQNDNNTTWRCLTRPEWSRLLQRSGDMAYHNKDGELLENNTRRAFTLAKVNNIRGMLIFPDVFYWPLDEREVSFSDNSSWGGATNEFSIAQWKILESAGCVFLPVTGRRKPNHSSNSDAGHGMYWSSSSSDGHNAGFVDFTASGITSFFETANCYKTTYYNAIRLVKNK